MPAGPGEPQQQASSTRDVFTDFRCASCGRKCTEGHCIHCSATGARPPPVRGPTSELTGQVLGGQYRVESILGRGGMGTVYRAVQLSVQRPVAVKVLSANRRAPQFAQRFAREAQLTSKLQHPNSIRVFDLGQTEQGVMFLVMELLEGVDLDDELSRCVRFDVGRVVRTARQILRALDEAHLLGMVHRDLKPSNIFLQRVGAERDIVKVMDFGLAKAFSETGDGPSITTEGMMVGTPAYMSPELIQGDPLGPQTDLYALGVMMFQMLTGMHPFESANAMDMMAKHIHHKPPPLARCPQVDSRGLMLQNLLDRLMAKSPSARPENARQVLSLLDGVFPSTTSEPVIPVQDDTAARLAAAVPLTVLDRPVQIPAEGEWTDATVRAHTPVPPDVAPAAASQWVDRTERVSPVPSAPMPATVTERPPQAPPAAEAAQGPILLSESALIPVPTSEIMLRPLVHGEPVAVPAVTSDVTLPPVAMHPPLVPSVLMPPLVPAPPGLMPADGARQSQPPTPAPAPRPSSSSTSPVLSEPVASNNAFGPLEGTRSDLVPWLSSKAPMGPQGASSSGAGRMEAAGRFVPGILVALLLAGGGAVLTLSRTEKADAPVATPPAAPVVAPVEAPVPVTPPPAPVVEEVTLEFTSTPSDAEVVVNGTAVGRTPLRHKVPRASTAMKVELRKDGFKPVLLEVTPGKDTPAPQVLEPLRPAVQPAPPPPSPRERPRGKRPR